MTQNGFQVEDRPAEGRYVIVDTEAKGGPAVAGEESYVDVVIDGATERVFYHTGVSDEYGGRGLASVLVRNAVEHAVSAGHKIVPVCPYVVAWFKKNAEFATHEVTARPEHLQAVSSAQ